MEPDTLRLAALLALTAVALFAAKRAMDQAAVGYFHVRGGRSPNPHAEMGMVWVVTCATISAVCTVTGMLLGALQRALR